MTELLRAKLAMLLIVAMSSASLSAQETASDTATATISTSVPETPSAQKGKTLPLKVAIGIQVGTIGPGLNLSFAFLEKWIFRLTGTYFQFDYVENNSELAYYFNTTARTGAVGVYADWFPFNKARGVGFTAGLAYSFVELAADGGSNEGYYDGTYSISPEEIGTITTVLTTSPVMPYLGLGFGRSVPNKRVNFRFELGAFYMGSPNVDMTATNFVSQTVEEAAQIEENVSNYNFYPNLTFNLNIKLN